MNTTEASGGFSPELMAELQEAADKAVKGIRDREAMRKARADMDPDS
jgi:hypothetical protein